MKLAQNVHDKIEFKAIDGAYGAMTVQILTGSGAPTAGASGTGTAPCSVKATLYLDTVNARLYINQGTSGHDSQWVYFNSTT